MLIFNYLIGNADAHSKNYAFLYRGNTPSLAPVYDVLCTAAYPRLSQKLAMKIGKRNVPDTIHLKHWNTLVAKTKTAEKVLAKNMKEMAEHIQKEADQLLEEFTKNGINVKVPSKINRIIHSRASHILSY